MPQQAINPGQDAWQSHPVDSFGVHTGEWFNPHLEQPALDQDFVQQQSQDLARFIDNLLLMQPELGANPTEPTPVSVPHSPTAFPALAEYNQVENDNPLSQLVMHAPIPTRNFGWFGLEHTRTPSGRVIVAVAPGFN
jgi:hypothetical protein